MVDTMVTTALPLTKTLLVPSDNRAMPCKPGVVMVNVAVVLVPWLIGSVIGVATSLPSTITRSTVPAAACEPWNVTL